MAQCQLSKTLDTKLHTYVASLRFSVSLDLFSYRLSFPHGQPH
jgi:hypothetical protein